MTGNLARLLKKAADAVVVPVVILVFITVGVICAFFDIYSRYYYPVEFRYAHIHPGIWLLALVCCILLYEFILKQVHELEASGKRRRTLLSHIQLDSSNWLFSNGIFCFSRQKSSFKSRLSNKLTALRGRGPGKRTMLGAPLGAGGRRGRLSGDG